MTLSVRLQHAFPGFDLDVEFDAPPGLTVLFGRGAMDIGLAVSD